MKYQHPYTCSVYTYLHKNTSFQSWTKYQPFYLFISYVEKNVSTNGLWERNLCIYGCMYVGGVCMCVHFMYGSYWYLPEFSLRKYSFRWTDTKAI